MGETGTVVQPLIKVRDTDPGTLDICLPMRLSVFGELGPQDNKQTCSVLLLL